MTTHTTTVDYDPHNRYPYRIICSQACQLRGYVSDHAARTMAAYHQETAE